MSDRERVRAIRHIIGRRQRNRRTAVEFGHPERCACAAEGIRVDAGRTQRQHLGCEQWPPRTGVTTGHAGGQFRTVETESVQARAFPEGELRFVELLCDAVAGLHEITRRLGRKHRDPCPVDPCLADKLTRQSLRHLERLRRARLVRRQVCRHRRCTFRAGSRPFPRAHQIYWGQASFSFHAPHESILALKGANARPAISVLTR